MFLIWKILYNREIHLSGYGGCILYLYRLDIRQVLMQRLLYRLDNLTNKGDNHE